MTKIEWTHFPGFKGETWNPITGCSHAGSPGCDHCYARNVFEKRLSKIPSSVYFGRSFGDVAFHQKRLDKPLRASKPRCFFVNSMSDLFHPSITFDQIASIFGIMASSPEHLFLILTKRPGRMLDFYRWLHDQHLADRQSHSSKCVDFAFQIISSTYSKKNVFQQGKTAPWPLKNVGLGVTVENQKQANIRIPFLMCSPASFRFISAEPLLGPIKFWTSDYSDLGHGHGWLNSGSSISVPKLDWVIVGGESGKGSRYLEPSWVRSILKQCADHNVPSYFKQWGEFDYIEKVKINPNSHRLLPEGYTIISRPGSDWKTLAHEVGKSNSGALIDGREVKNFPLIDF